MRRAAGFTLLELVIVVGIVGILASAALPLTRWSVKRQREYELREALRILRDAIDRYHDLALAGLIDADPETMGYPPSLEVLVEGVELRGQLPPVPPVVSDGFTASGLGLVGGFSARAATGAAAAEEEGEGEEPDRRRRPEEEQEEPQRIVLLRRVPVDPFTGKADWTLRCYGQEVGARIWCGRHVFDVHSRSRATGLNGVPYREW